MNIQQIFMINIKQITFTFDAGKIKMMQFLKTNQIFKILSNKMRRQ